jgi:hypothetical protein
MKPKPAKPTPNRVTNNLGTLFSGGASRRIIILIDRKAFVEIAHANDLPAAVARNTRSIVLGVVRLRVEDDTYHADIVEGDDKGYHYILLQLASAAAEADGMDKISWGRQPHVPRPWGPFQGLRRRGFASRAKFQTITKLSNERMNQLVELLWRTAGFGFGANSPAEGAPELQ